MTPSSVCFVAIFALPGSATAIAQTDRGLQTQQQSLGESGECARPIPRSSTSTRPTSSRSLVVRTCLFQRALRDVAANVPIWWQTMECAAPPVVLSSSLQSSNLVHLPGQCVDGSIQVCGSSARSNSWQRNSSPYTFERDRIHRCRFSLLEAELHPKGRKQAEGSQRGCVADK